MFYTGVPLGLPFTPGMLHLESGGGLYKGGQAWPMTDQANPWDGHFSEPLGGPVRDGFLR